MGIKLNIFSLVLVVVFVTGIIISAFLLFNLPNSLLKETTVLDLKDVPAIMPVLSKVNYAVGGTLVIGLVVIVMFLFSNSENSKSTIISSNTKGQAKGKSEEDVDTQDTESDIEIKAYEELFKPKQTPEELSTSLLTTLCKQLEASQGAIYFTKKTKDQRLLELKGSYAYILPDSKVVTYEFGEGLVGQAAKTGKTTHIQDVPEGYIEIFSGLGHSKPGQLLIIPIKNDQEVLAVAEIASFKPLNKKEIRLSEKVFDMFAENMAKAKTSKAVEKEEKIG